MFYDKNVSLRRRTGNGAGARPRCQIERALAGPTGVCKQHAAGTAGEGDTLMGRGEW